MGQLGDPRAVGPLTAMLKDSHEEVRRVRCRSVGHARWDSDQYSGATYPQSFPQVPPMVAEGCQKGDRIGEFEVQGVSGRGGFGVVYLVVLYLPEGIYTFGGSRDKRPISRGTKSTRYFPFALKTFRDEYMAYPQVRQRFRHEAQVLVQLDRHPHLLEASFVQEIAGRLYIATEWVAPNTEGLNSLEGYLLQRPPDLAQSLRWAIQCCYGMEYAHSKGLRCHRDLKPANILITQDLSVKIADFGLAGTLDLALVVDGILVHVRMGAWVFPAKPWRGWASAHPRNMPPEQFTCAAACDERSDIYAFGVVLYQMATGGRVPFQAAPLHDYSLEERRRFWTEMRQLHATAAVPKLHSPLFPIIRRCLAKEPNQRYLSFRALREVLELLLRHETGEIVEPPVVGELKALHWRNKAASLSCPGATGRSHRLLRPGSGHRSAGCNGLAQQGT